MKQLTILLLLALCISATSQKTHTDKFNASGKSIIGVWVDTSFPAAIGDIKVVIYKENDKHYMALIASEVYNTFPLNIKKVSNQTRYHDTRNNSSDYYIIGLKGLMVYDSQGYITTYSKSRLQDKLNVARATVIGVWTDSGVNSEVGEEMKLIIYKQGEEYYLSMSTKESIDIYPLEKKKLGNSIRYHDVESPYGEYFIIIEDGLMVYDSDGYIGIYKNSKL